jgi:hypothetical protein
LRSQDVLACLRPVRASFGDGVLAWSGMCRLNLGLYNVEFWAAGRLASRQGRQAARQAGRPAGGQAVTCALSFHCSRRLLEASAWFRSALLLARPALTSSRSRCEGGCVGWMASNVIGWLCGGLGGYVVGWFGGWAYVRSRAICSLGTSAPAHTRTASLPGATGCLDKQGLSLHACPRPPVSPAAASSAAPSPDPPAPAPPKPPPPCPAPARAPG